MRRSSGITLTLLTGLVLTACLTTGGCRRRPDTTWYDVNHNRIPEKWTTNADGKRVPDPHPYDRYGHLWVYDANGNLVPPAPPAGSTHRAGPALWLWGGSGYRSSGSSYSSGSSSSSTSSSSVSRGGFGSTGMSSGG